jgi:ketosteroid isomerase-like protein
LIVISAFFCKFCQKRQISVKIANTIGFNTGLKTIFQSIFTQNQVVLSDKFQGMKQQENQNIASKWFDAFNTHDLEKLLSLYHEEAVHYSPKLKVRKPETNGYVKGKAALRDWWQDAFERIPSLNYSVTTLTADDERVFMEYVRRADGDPEMLVAEVLEIKDGMIMASRVYHG